MQNKSDKTIRILIADDHQMFIDGVKAILKGVKNISVSGEALNGKDAIELFNKEEYDLVIADIEMPEMNGIELTKIIKEKNPEIKVLIVTSHPDRSFIEETIEAHADGYILKNTSKQELIDAITKVADGGGYYSNEILSILSEIHLEKAKIHEETEVLTPREKEIISLICKEHCNTEIADILFISPLTVETHRKNIYRKTKTKTIVGLIKYAIENKLA